MLLIKIREDNVLRLREKPTGLKILNKKFKLTMDLYKIIDGC